MVGPDNVAATAVVLSGGDSALCSFDYNFPVTRVPCHVTHYSCNVTVKGFFFFLSFSSYDFFFFGAVLVYNKIERKVQRFLIYVFLPHLQSLLRYQRHLPEWHLLTKGKPTSTS